MKLIHTTFAAGVISKYDALASSHPHLATSLVSLSTYTAAELVRVRLVSSSIASKHPPPIDSVVRGGGGLHLRQGLTGVLLMGLLARLCPPRTVDMLLVPMLGDHLSPSQPMRHCFQDCPRPGDWMSHLLRPSGDGHWTGRRIWHCGHNPPRQEGYVEGCASELDGMASAPCDQFLACATGPTKVANSGRWFGMGHISLQTNGQTRYHHDCRSHGTS